MARSTEGNGKGNGKIVRVVYYTIMPVLTAGSLFFGIGSKIGKSRDNPGHNPGTKLESRIRALEVKQDERHKFIMQSLSEIKARLNNMQ